MSKSTRSSKTLDSSLKSQTKVAALQKVFFIPEELLRKTSPQLKLEYFYHPGKGKPALFLTKDDGDIMEVLEFSEPRRSWLINNDVCSNGSIYMVTPIDVTFLVLHHFRKHCSQKALSLDNIGDPNDTSTLRLLREFVQNEEQLKCVADVKIAGSMVFYKYNQQNTLAWLSVKVRRICATLQSIGAHASHSAMSQNYVCGEMNGDIGEETKMDYLRMACDIVGDYIDFDLHEELQKYLKIPNDPSLSTSRQEKKEENVNKKRKSVEKLKSSGNKKVKMESKGEGLIAELKNSTLLDKDDDDVESKSSTSSGSGELHPVDLVEVVQQMSPVKERVLTAKEKALAKSAKGTKSIALFFKK